MIWSVLDKRLGELFVECSQFLATVEKIGATAELREYKEWMTDEATKLQAESQDLLEIARHRYPDLLSEVLSSLQQRRRHLKLLRDRLFGPLARSGPSDRMALRLFGWLHRGAEATRKITFAVADGPFSTWPFLPHAAVYFGPVSGGSDLRHISLFCHEFGHVLYGSRAKQLDARVGQLQKMIEAILSPRSVRNDARAHAELLGRERIVGTWYQWSQEFFCDAVGLTIAGPSYLNAFSSHLQLLGLGDFPSQEDSEAATHPPTRLRVELLVDRAQRLHLDVDATKVWGEWQAISSTIGFDDDYFGFYVSEMSSEVHSCIDEMLQIAQPYQFSARDLEPCVFDEIAVCNPVRLMNTAWHLYDRSEDGFRSWEQQCEKYFVAQAAEIT
jgi:hypothetical protein